jgi:hypothetical protein
MSEPNESFTEVYGNVFSRTVNSNQPSIKDKPMSAQFATYTAVKQPGPNELAKIQPDATGYWPMVLGGFNIANEHGEFYEFNNKIKSLFEDDSIMLRRLKKGLCCAEYGHPKLEGLNDKQQVARVAHIDGDRICNHIRKVVLESAVDEFRKPVVLVRGEIAPDGPFGDIVDRQLKNPCRNVAYSGRYFNEFKMVAGKLIRTVTDVVNYDWVVEGGVGIATQFQAVSLEEFVEIYKLRFTLRVLDAAIKELEQRNDISFEEDTSTLKMVKTSLGWEGVNIVNGRSFVNAWN